MIIDIDKGYTNPKIVSLSSHEYFLKGDILPTHRTIKVWLFDKS